MARRRTKKRTHVGAKNGLANGVLRNPVSREPKTMVVRIGAGEVGPSVSQLVKDVRSMMEPGTASRLKERRSNRLRDYTAIAGPLGVSHLLLFSRSATGNTNLRLALTPRGPTLHFRVEKYSLSKDVRKAQRHPQGGGKECLTAPLLVMNNFTTPPPVDGSEPVIPKHLESLTTTIFQSLFPPISPASTPLSSIRRVLLVNREVLKGSKESNENNEGSYILNLRHYSITTKRTGLSRGIKRLNAAEKLISQGSKKNQVVPNLGKLEDVAQYILDPPVAGYGLSSASESEVESDAGVEVLGSAPRKVLNKKQMSDRRANGAKMSNGTQLGIEKRAVKLVELGPRMKLRLIKVEEGVCGGKIMWHGYMNKTGEEVKSTERAWEERRQEKEERKKTQKENVDRKGKEKMGPTAIIVRGIEQAKEAYEDEAMEDHEEAWDGEGLEDDQADWEEEAVALG